MALDRHAADLDRFRRLEMRPQHDAGVAQPVAHALEVAAQDRTVENEGGRRKVVERLGGHLAILAHADRKRTQVCPEDDDGGLEPLLAADARA